MPRSLIELSQYNWLLATIYFNLTQPALKFTEQIEGVLSTPWRTVTIFLSSWTTKTSPLTSDAGDLDETKLKLEACINSVNAWMLHNNLQLNDNKTKILVFYAKLRPALSLYCLQVASANLKPTNYTRNIGVIFYSNLSFDN